MSADLTLPAARIERDEFAGRTDVLDKVGVLRCLSDDMHAMTAEVANFYEVDAGTIRQTVNRNREEFDDDGYTVLTRGEFEGSYNMSLPSSASTVALFPRRAVLRVGMLLRDSPVARRVRDYLLDSEEGGLSLDPSNLTRMQILELAMDSERRALQAESQLAADRPLVERSRNRNNGQSKQNRQEFFRELKQWAHHEHRIEVRQEHVMAFLSTAKLGIFIRGERRDAGQATAWAIERGYAVNDEDTARNGREVVVGRLTAKGQDYAWERCLRYIDANGTLELPRQIAGGAA